MEQFTEGDLKACTLFWALTRTLDEDWPCRETAKTSQDCCDKVHSRRCSSASSRQSSQISAQAGPRHSFTRKLLMQSIQNRLCLPQTPLCSGRLFVFPRKPFQTPAPRLPVEHARVAQGRVIPGSCLLAVSRRMEVRIKESFCNAIRPRRHLVSVV